MDGSKNMGPSILVVEDEEALSALLEYNLQREGFAPTVIPDGDEAAYYASAIASPVDVPVLSDVHADIVEATPFEGTSLPGRCLLSPQMEILSCKTGKGEDDDLYAVAEHHAG